MNIPLHIFSSSNAHNNRFERDASYKTIGTKAGCSSAGCLRNLIHAVVKNPEHPPGVFVSRVFSFTSY